MGNTRENEHEDILKDVDMDTNYYQVLGLDHMATKAQITTKWKELVIKAHPDKNPDNPDAGETFQKLRNAFNILKDEKIKAAYDIIIRKKIANEHKLLQMSKSRREMKQDLKKREEEFIKQQQEMETDKRVFANVLQRANEDKLRRMQTKKEQILKQNTKSAVTQMQTSARINEEKAKTLKVSWKSKDETHYSESNLRKIFESFGEIDLILIGKKKKSCMINYKHSSGAVLASKQKEQLLGQPDNPLFLSYQSTSASHSSASLPSASSNQDTALQNKKLKVEADTKEPSSLEDFENLIFSKLANQ